MKGAPCKQDLNQRTLFCNKRVKAMLDIKWIRQDPKAFDAALSKRGEKPCSKELLFLDEDVRSLILAVETLRSARNAHAKKMGLLKQQGGSGDALVKEGGELREKLEAKEEALLAQKRKLDAWLWALPNKPLDDVPLSDKGKGVCVRTWGTKPVFDFKPQPHEVVGSKHGLETKAGVALSGARFVVLKGFVARLERALAHFMLDLHTQKFGYEEVSPPYLVKEEALFNVGQLPKFKEDAFQTTDNRWLISTSEVSLTNLAAGQIFDEAQLPKRYVAYTPCFRSEAGSAGRDVHGMIRLHQFSKVELVALTTPQQSQEAHEAMLSHAEEVLKRLQLPYRVVLLSADDMGFSASKTYDLEVWFPSQNAYREISSCSTCGDFQARRMRGRFKTKAGEKALIHTLNGSGVAVGRCLAAILENYQKKDGSVVLPPVLERYMKGL